MDEEICYQLDSVTAHGTEVFKLMDKSVAKLVDMEAEPSFGSYFFKT